MIIDNQNLLSDAQALTASGASTNLIDLGSDRDFGVGEPMAVVVTVDVAADGTTTDETYAFAIQTDDNASFSSATTLESRTIGYASLTAGSQHVLNFPSDGSCERYVRLYATLGGTTPTITFTAFVTPVSAIQNNRLYADGITIS